MLSSRFCVLVSSSSGWSDTSSRFFNSSQSSSSPPLVFVDDVSSTYSHPEISTHHLLLRMIPELLHLSKLEPAEFQNKHYFCKAQNYQVDLPGLLIMLMQSLLSHSEASMSIKPFELMKESWKIVVQCILFLSLKTVQTKNCHHWSHF